MRFEKLLQRILCLALVLGLLTGGLPALADGVNIIGTVLVTNAVNVNIRSGGDTSYPILGKASPGAIFEVTGQAASGWYQILLDDGSAGYLSNKLVTFTPAGTSTQPGQTGTAGIRATIQVTYRSATGTLLASEAVVLAYGSNIVSANDTKVPAGYALLSSRRVTVNVDINGIPSPAGVIFTYGGSPYTAPTQAPQSATRVPVYYKDIYGALLNTSYVDLYPGSSLLSANNAMVPAGYTLVGSKDAVVSVSAGYVAIPSSVTFIYTRAAQPTQPPQINATVPVYYINTSGTPLNTVYVSLPFGTQTVSANPSLVPAGYQLVSPASVVVTVNAYGVASPTSVVFSYQVLPTQAPLKVVNIPVYYKAEDGSLLNTVYVSVTQGNNTVQANNGNVPAGYTIISGSAQPVSVDANGLANPGSVTFTYRPPAPPVTVSIPVVYRDHTGGQLNAVTASVSSNLQNKVTADNNYAPAGWVLISPRTVSVTVTPQGVANPAQVVFTYQDPATIVDPVLLPEFVKTSPNKGNWPVYTGPGPDWYRVGNATLGGGTIRVYGQENGWALIGYGLSNGGYRIGFVEMAAIPSNIQPQPLLLVHVAKNNVSNSLFVDDPIVSEKRELKETIPGGSPFILLGYLNDFWAYVEIDNFGNSGKPARGFVSRRSLGTP
ncbi:MAG: SH3 domain-containing protein [Christensenellales bacterium]